MKTRLLLAAAVAALMISPVAARAQDDGPSSDRPARAHRMDRKEHRQDRMGKVDTDKDGKVSKDEFLAAHAAQFDEMDTDGDGYLSPDERKAAWEKHRGKMKDRMQKWREHRGDRRDGGPGGAPDDSAE